RATTCRQPPADSRANRPGSRQVHVKGDRHMSASTPTATASPADATTRAPVARRLRRYMAGVALILFPALLVVEAPIDPAGDGTGEEMYAAATGHSGALAIAAALLFISGVLMIPAVAAILHQARDRGSALANI